MIRNLTDYVSGEEFLNVEIVEEDDLPRGCDSIAYIESYEDFERYTIYKDCVTHLLYAIKENEDE